MPLPLTTLASRGVSSLQQARTARADRRRLRAELDSYRTEAERAELGAILARHSEQEREELARSTGVRSWAA